MGVEGGIDGVSGSISKPVDSNGYIAVIMKPFSASINLVAITTTLRNEHQQYIRIAL